MEAYMKVSFYDYFLSTIVISSLLFLSGFTAFYLFSKFSFEIFHNYSYLINALLFFLCYGLLSGAFLHIILKIRPLKTGEFKMDHPEFTYWKLLTMIHYFGEKSLFLLNQAPFMPLLAKIFGAKVGKNIAIGGKIDSPFLVTLADNVVLGHGSLVSANYIQNGNLFLGPVIIKKNATVGVYSLILPHTTLEENSSVHAGAVVNPGTIIPSGESWKGNPARKWQ